ncbi:MAG: hypothetical protein CMK98_16210 [Pseudomonas sp.]|nr:hypothetical protein [Pseudomonas sp.]
MKRNNTLRIVNGINNKTIFSIIITPNITKSIYCTLFDIHINRWWFYLITKNIEEPPFVLNETHLKLTIFMLHLIKIFKPIRRESPLTKLMPRANRLDYIPLQ